MTTKHPKAPSLTLVGFYLEVAAENERVLGDKLFGPDDLEAAIMASAHIGDVGDFLDYCEEEGIDPYDHPDVATVPRCEQERVQSEWESVNDLLRNAEIGGCPVLFKTDGTNLGLSGDGPTEIPHFGHGASKCEKPYDACWDGPDAGGVYRVFGHADLIVEGDFDLSAVGSYWLRDDVMIHVTLSGRPGYGMTAAEPVEN